jgi:hypothetical protein
MTPSTWSSNAMIISWSFAPEPIGYLFSVLYLAMMFVLARFEIRRHEWLMVKLAFDNTDEERI